MGLVIIKKGEIFRTFQRLGMHDLYNNINHCHLNIMLTTKFIT
jgi:hypothetical protein